MADRVAHGEVYIDLNDRGLTRGLKEADARFERQMREWNGREAEARLKINTRDAEKGLKQYEDRIDELAKREEAYNKQGNKAWATRMKNQREAYEQERDLLKQRIDLGKDNLETIQRTNREVQSNNKRLEIQNRKDLAYRKEIEASDKRKLKTMNDAHTIALRMNADLDKQNATMSKIVANSDKMKVRHAQLQQELAKINKELDRVFITTKDRTLFDLNKGKVLREMAEIEAALKGIGDEHVNVEVDVDDDTDKLARWARAITDTTVRVGPFTTSLGGLFRAMSLLAPVVTGLVGSLGALAGVLGTGIGGAGALGAAGLTGFAMALFGVGAILKPMIGNYGEAKAALESYNDAVLKYGKNSEEAKEKLHDFNNILGNVDPQARKAFMALQNIGKEWRKLTQDETRPAFFNSIKELNDTVQTLMPQFAKRSVDAFKIVSNGFNGLMQSLRSPDIAGALDFTFGNFNNFLRPALNGVNALVRAFIRLSASGSRWLPHFGQVFENWATGMDKAASNSTRLNASVDRLVNHLRSVGRWAMSAGRLIGAFFNAGADSGQSFLESLTAAQDRWTAWIKSTEGHNSLSEWFEQSIQTTKLLFQALAPFLQLFAQWSSALRPVTNELLRLVAAFGDIIEAVVGTKAGLIALQTAATTFFALWSAGKIMAIATALKSMVTALKAVQVASVATATTAGASNLASWGSKAAAAAPIVAPVSSRATATVAKAGTTAAQAGQRFGMLRTAAKGAGAALLGLAGGPVGVAVAGTAALAYGVYKLANMESEAGSAAIRMAAAHRQAAHGLKGLQSVMGSMTPAAITLEQAQLSQKAAQQEVNRLIKAGKKGTDEYRQALINLRSAQTYASQAHDEWNKIARKEVKASEDLVDGKKKILDQALLERSLIKEGTDAWDAYDQKVKEATFAYETALNRQVAANVNRQRALNMVEPVAKRAEQSVGQFARTFAGVKNFKRFILRADDRQAVAKISNLGNKLNKAGKGATVVRILAHSKNADDAVRRLNKALDRYEKRHPKATLDVNENPAKKGLNGIEGILGKYGKSKHTSKVDADVAPADSKIKITGKNVDTLDKKRAKPRADMDAAQAIGMIARVMSLLSSIDGRVTNSYHIQHNRVVNEKATGGPWDVAQKSEQRRMLQVTAGPARQTTGGRYSEPTLLVGEEHRPEFVIATNPAYRKQNIAYLQQAAMALGVVPAAKGRSPYETPKKQAKSPGSGWIKAGGKGRNTLWVFHTWRRTPGGRWVSPEREGAKQTTRVGGGAGHREKIKGSEYEYMVGAVSEETASKYVSEYRTTDSAIRSKQNEIHRTVQDLKRVPKGPGKKIGTGKSAYHVNTKKRDDLKKQLKRLRSQKKDLIKKRKGQRYGYRLALANKAAGKRIDAEQDEVLAADDLMGIAEQNNDPNAWESARGTKGSHLRTLIGLLQTAFDEAHRGDHKSELRRELSQAKLDLATLKNESFQSAMSVDSMLTPFENDALSKINADLALVDAKLPMQYGPGSWKGFVPAGYADEPKWALVGFWGSVLKRAIAANNAPLITQAASNYKTAKDAAQGAEEATGGVSQAELYNQERFSLLRDFAGNVGAVAGQPTTSTPFNPITGVVANPNATGGGDELLTGQGFPQPTTKAPPVGTGGPVPAPSDKAAWKRTAKKQLSKKQKRRARKTGKVWWTDPTGKEVLKGKNWKPPASTARALSSISNPFGTAAAMGSSYGGAFRTFGSTGTSSGGSVTYKTINQNNTFSAPPPDPHTWSQSTNYELTAAV